jgi:hypothetical protein
MACNGTALLYLNLYIFVLATFTAKKTLHATKNPATGLDIEKPAIPLKNR